MSLGFQVVIVNFRIYAIAVILLLAQGLAAARAESSAEPVARVREALVSSYGQALIAEFGTNLRAGADAACLDSKGITADQLAARGLALMTKWGTRMAETSDSLIDKKVYAEKFSGHAELAKLRQDASVQRYLAVAQPIQSATTLNSIFEQFDRYIMLKRIKLSPTSPAASGNEVLMNKDPAGDAGEKLEKFVAASKSAALKRYLALTRQDAAARTGSIRKADLLQAVPTTFFQGVETDLAELCITKR